MRQVSLMQYNDKVINEWRVVVGRHSIACCEMRCDAMPCSDLRCHVVGRPGQESDVDDNPAAAPSRHSLPLFAGCALLSYHP